MTNESSEYDFVTNKTEPIQLLNLKPNYSITFCKDGETIGEFDFNGPALKFIGECEESAQIFINWAMDAFSQRLKDEHTTEESLDCARFKWLTSDIYDSEIRQLRNTILQRMHAMSYSAACSDIDYVMSKEADDSN